MFSQVCFRGCMPCRLCLLGCVCLVPGPFQVGWVCPGGWLSPRVGIVWSWVCQRAGMGIPDGVGIPGAVYVYPPVLTPSGSHQNMYSW